jgi:pimeloyl-ACP methyl ester carboxylesterase
MDIVTRNNIRLLGREDGRPMVFAHGFGCDQSMWRFVTPAFEDEYRIVLFDHVGAGGSDISATIRTGTARWAATRPTCSRSAVRSTSATPIFVGG